MRAASVLPGDDRLLTSSPRNVNVDVHFGAQYREAMALRIAAPSMDLDASTNVAVGQRMKDDPECVVDGVALSRKEPCTGDPNGLHMATVAAVHHPPGRESSAILAESAHQYSASS